MRTFWLGLSLAILSLACDTIVNDQVEIIQGDVSYLHMPVLSELYPCRYEVLDMIDENWREIAAYFAIDVAPYPKVVYQVEDALETPSPGDFVAKYDAWDNAIVMYFNSAESCQGLSHSQPIPVFSSSTGSIHWISVPGYMEQVMRHELFHAAHHRFVGMSGWSSTADFHKEGIAQSLIDVGINDSLQTDFPWYGVFHFEGFDVCDLDEMTADWSSNSEEEIILFYGWSPMVWRMIRYVYGDEIIRSLISEVSKGTSLRDSLATVVDEQDWDWLEITWDCGNYFF